MRNDKSDLKGFQRNFETLLYKYLSQSDTCQLKSALEKKKSACKFLKNNETSLIRTITTMFSSKTVNDLTEGIIHSHRRLIYVRRFTFVHLVIGEESNCK